MKKNKLLMMLIATILFSACQPNKTEVVNDYLMAIKESDTEKIDLLLADDFIYEKEGQVFNKSEYLERQDSLKSIDYRTELIKIYDQDSIIKTEEKVVTIIDSLLEISPRIIQKKTYNFERGKITRIAVDTTLNKTQYEESLKEKMIPFAFYVNEQHGVQNNSEFFNNIKKYLSEYSTLPASERRNYRIYSSLQGTYVSDNSIYAKLVFRGKKTVTIVDAIFGFPFATSYEIDEQYIKIETDQSDLLLEIKNSNTLVGEGWASGLFVKIDE
jgi:DNA-binding phage protein